MAIQPQLIPTWRKWLLKAYSSLSSTRLVQCAVHRELLCSQDDTRLAVECIPECLAATALEVCSKQSYYQCKVLYNYMKMKNGKVLHVYLATNQDLANLGEGRQINNHQLYQDTFSCDYYIIFTKCTRYIRYIYASRRSHHKEYDKADSVCVCRSVYPSCISVAMQRKLTASYRLLATFSWLG